MLMENKFSCYREGLKIGGTEYRLEGEQLPIAIVCHGFTSNQERVKEYTQILAELGYAAYCFDFNGGSLGENASEGKTTDMSVLTETRDLQSVIEYTQSLSYTDENNILLMGCSQGGMVSALVAAKNKYPVKKLVLFYPAFCIPDDARAGSMQIAKFDPVNVPETFYCGPMKLGRIYATDVNKMDVFAEIKDYNSSVLLIHGTADKIVDVKYALEAEKVYLSSKPENMSDKERIQMHLIENAPHGFYDADRIKAVQWLKEYAKKED